MSGEILVIDDSDSVRRLVTSALRLAGYQTVEAPDGQIGLDKARSKMPSRSSRRRR